MSSGKGVIFIIGGGARIGHSVAKQFLNDGYRVAVGRRNPKETSDDPDLSEVLAVGCDVMESVSISNAFGMVKSKLGTPNVVVYNAAALTFPEDAQNPFAIDTSAFERDLCVNVSGAYVAMHLATLGFLELPEGLPKVFIATGNVTPFQPVPQALTLGAGKAALAHLVDIGNNVYASQGMRFVFVSQVTEAGGPVPYPEVSGSAHGTIYSNIVHGSVGQGRWDLRFVVGPDGVATIS